jgi:hypothetical protein
LNPTSRAMIFSVLEKEMALDYTPVFAAWQARRGKPLSEGAFEGVLYFQRDLLAYVDRMVSPRDLQYRDTILEYANGLAISKLGRSVKDQVIEHSGMRPKSLHGLGQKNRQEEAFRAIGYWLEPAHGDHCRRSARAFRRGSRGGEDPRLASHVRKRERHGRLDRRSRAEGSRQDQDQG